MSNRWVVVAGLALAGCGGGAGADPEVVIIRGDPASEWLDLTIEGAELDAPHGTAGGSGMRGGVSLAFESATAGDAAWYGGAVGGCVRIAFVCAGGRVRAGRSTPPHHGLTALDLLATAELPIARAGFVVAPGATLGVGWTRATTDDPHAVDPSVDIGGVRAGVQLAVTRPLTGPFAIELLLAFDGAILGNSDAPAALPRSLGRIGLGLRYGGR